MVNETRTYTVILEPAEEGASSCMCRRFRKS